MGSSHSKRERSDHINSTRSKNSNSIRRRIFSRYRSYRRNRRKSFQYDSEEENNEANTRTKKTEEIPHIFDSDNKSESKAENNESSTRTKETEEAFDSDNKEINKSESKAENNEPNPITKETEDVFHIVDSDKTVVSESSLITASPENKADTNQVLSAGKDQNNLNSSESTRAILMKYNLRILKSDSDLTQLDLCESNLEHIPEEIFQLSFVQRLSLSRNKISSIPSNISKLCKLEELILDRNPIESIESDISGLSSLYLLDLSYCNLVTIPEMIYRIASLTNLVLMGNEITAIPSMAKHMASLKILNLLYNKISEISPELSECQNLEELLLGDNHLQVLPDELGNLKKLKVLKIWDNQFEKFPDAILGMESLVEFYAGNNKFSNLPRGMSKLNIRKIGLSNNRFKGLPAVFLKLSTLKYLSIRQNGLSSLPVGFGKLNIEELTLMNNNFAEFPRELIKLKTLKILNLRNNKLTSLPSEISQMKQLHSLDLEGNHLREIPSSLCSLNQLLELSLASNEIASIPSEIKELESLQLFNLSANLIQLIPESLCQLTNLETLNLEGNMITRLPFDFDNLVNLKKGEQDRTGLNLDGNSMQLPPQEICNQGPEEIFQYIKELKSSKAVTARRLKIMLIGETGSGKTSLANTVIRQQPYLTKDEDRTKVLEQHLWPVEEDLEFQINDFGGHEIYYLTSQFFLTHEAINLLVFYINQYTCSLYDKLIGSWIKILNDRVPGAVIYLVGTHSDEASSDEEIGEKSKEILERVQTDEAEQMGEIKILIEEINHALANQSSSLKRSHDLYGLSSHDLRQRKRYLEEKLSVRLQLPARISVVSSKSFKGIHSLISEIQELASNDLLFPKRIVPETWIQLQTELKAKRKDDIHYLNWNELMPIADSCSKMSDYRVINALHYLHAIGEILWYDDDPELVKFVFHNPHRLIDIIKSVFRHDVESFLNYADRKFAVVGGFTKPGFDIAREDFLKRGLLSENLLKCFWKDFGLGPDGSNTLVNLMKKFDLCYHVEESEHTPGVSTDCLHFPWFLSEQEPEHMRDFFSHAVPEECQQLMVEFGFPVHCPPSFFEKATVRLQQHISAPSRRHWKNGVCANINQEKVRLTRYQKNGQEVIQVAVRGTRKSSIWRHLIKILNSIKQLFNQWPGVRYQYFLLCAHCVKFGLSEPHHFPGEMLHHPCPEGTTHLTCSNMEDGTYIDAELVYPPKHVTLKEIDVLKTTIGNTVVQKHYYNFIINSQNIQIGDYNTMNVNENPDVSQTNEMELQASFEFLKRQLSLDKCKQLVKFFGIDDTDLDYIEQENPGNEINLKKEMFILWKTKLSGDIDAISQLINGLEAIDCNQLADKLRYRMKEDILSLK